MALNINPDFGDGPNAHSDKRWLSLLAAALLGLLFAALGTVWWLYYSDANRQPDEIRIGAGPVGTDSYVYLTEVAEIINRSSKHVHLQIIPTQDASQNISLLNRDALDMAVVRGDTPLGGQSRLVAELYPDYFQFIADGTLPIFDIRDLAGKRIAIPEFGTDAHRSFFAVADHYDLPVENVRWSAVPFSDARRGLMNGRFDAIFTVRSLRDPQLVGLFEDAQLKHKQLNFVPVRQAEAMALKRPFLKAGRIPFGSFTGAGPVPNADLVTAYVDRVLVSREDSPEDAVREITATMFDKRLELALRFPLAASVDQPDEEDNLMVALHEGATQFYDRAKPGLFEAYSDQIGLIITLFAMAGSALLAMRGWFVSKQKNRADIYNYKLLDLLERARHASSEAELVLLRDEHAEILKAIVIALDSDKVTDEGFQSFSLLWESVRNSLAQRQQELLAESRQTRAKPPRKTK